MHVLMISNDQDICLNNDPLPQGHTRIRHRKYLQELQKQTAANSKLTIMVPVKQKIDIKPQHEPSGLSIIPVATFKRAFSLIQMLFPLFCTVKAAKPDLITAQSPWESGILAILAGRFFNIPVLLQLHGDIGSKEWNKQSLGYLLRAFLSKLTCKRAQQIRVVSNKMRVRLVEDWKLPPEKISVVPVPVDFDRNNSLSREASKNNLVPGLGNFPTVLFVGRFYAPKNLKLWVETAAAITKLNPTVRFIIAGDGEEKITLLELLKKHSLSEKTVLTGFVNRNKLPDLYNCGDVALLTSSHEAFGLVVVESLLSQTPIVSTATSGPSEILSGELGELLIHSVKAQDLAEAVVNLLNDPQKRKSLGEKGAMIMKERYSEKTITRRVVENWIKTVNNFHNYQN